MDPSANPQFEDWNPLSISRLRSQALGHVELTVGSTSLSLPAKQRSRKSSLEI